MAKKQDSQQVKDTLNILISFIKMTEPRFRSIEFVAMCVKLVESPGIKLSMLLLFLETEAKISRGTADRLTNNAADAGLILFEKTQTSRRPTLVTLSPAGKEQLQNLLRCL